MSQNVNITYNGSEHTGDNNFIELTSLEQAIEQIKKSLGEEKEAVDIIEELADYITEHPDRKIIGLDCKLKNGDREDLSERAVLLKNRFERRVAKNQMSLAEQKSVHNSVSARAFRYPAHHLNARQIRSPVVTMSNSNCEPALSISY